MIEADAALAEGLPGADHLEDFTVDPVEGEPGGDPGGDTAPGLGLREPGSEFLSREVFFGGFCLAFNVGASVPPYVKALAIAKAEEAAALEASNALYDICLETPALHFLVKPGGVWFQRIAAIGAFTVPKGLAVAGEVKARRAVVVQGPGEAPKRQAGTGGAGAAREAEGGLVGDRNAYDFAPRDAA